MIKVRALAVMLNCRQADVVKALWVLGHHGVTIEHEVPIDVAAKTAEYIRLTLPIEAIERAGVMMRPPKWDVW